MGQSDLIDYITDYYKRLYTSEASAPSTKEAQELCWRSVPPSVAEDTNSFLTQKLTLAEVLKAIRALPKGKAPGHDGVPFSDTWVCWVKTLYKAASSTIKVNGTIGPDFPLERFVRQG
jgi:hypothetical protein